MTELRFEIGTFLASELGPENPLPALVNQRELHAVSEAPGIPEEILDNLGRGDIPSILPYTIQDGYNRELQPTPLEVAVMENEHLRAVFLLELGGRMWSLVDKDTGRELLYRNECIQFANLALRNAWFAGGVEWNCGIVGHTPLTCAPVFAARIGETTLRLYEWERIRGVLYQLDFSLPADSRSLYVTVTIRNPHDHEIPMYWWSNIAVPQAEGTRVLVPASKAYVFGYKGALTTQPVPEFTGTDVTYAYRAEWPQDYFFDVPAERLKWIAAIDQDGYGLVQTSTERLQGRKLFLWGTGPSGRSWQRMLSPLGGQYLEIQAGLAKTQLEYVRMPATARWSWTESYGPIQTDASIEDWTDATSAVEVTLDDHLLRVIHEEATERIEHEPTEIRHLGSGWGFLEQERRRRKGEKPLPNAGLPFPESSVGVTEGPWLDLLRDGKPAAFDPNHPSFMVQPEWCEYLNESPYHLATLKWNVGEIERAAAVWLKALEETPTAWIHRNLAVHYRKAGRIEDARNHYMSAYGLEPACRPLAIEVSRFLLEIAPSSSLAFISQLSPQLRRDSRLRLIEACAAMKLGDLETVRRFFGEVSVVTDLREGETTYDELLSRFSDATGTAPTHSFRMTSEAT